MESALFTSPSMPSWSQSSLFSAAYSVSLDTPVNSIKMSRSTSGSPVVILLKQKRNCNAPTSGSLDPTSTSRVMLLIIRGNRRPLSGVAFADQLGDCAAAVAAALKLHAGRFFPESDRLLIVTG